MFVPVFDGLIDQGNEIWSIGCFRARGFSHDPVFDKLHHRSLKFLFFHKPGEDPVIYTVEQGGVSCIENSVILSNAILHRRIYRQQLLGTAGSYSP